MRRYLAAVALALTVALMQGMVLGADEGGKKRAYKPRQGQRAAEAQPAQASSKDEETAPPAGYDAELQAAKEKRDKELESASAETDRRTLEKRKTEIFAQYAQIVAALRDKYYEENPDAAKGQAQSSAKPRAKAGTNATKRDPAPAQQEATPRKERAKKPRADEPESLADAEQKLDEENTRHQAKLDGLNAQLQQAETSGNKRQVRAAQKAIEKENNSYNARRTILERRVKDLGGTLGGPAPTDAPAPKE
jgi:hypothetical protein